MSRKIIWTEEMIADLGVLTDGEISKKWIIDGEELGRVNVVRERRRRNIPAVGEFQQRIEHEIIEGIECKWCHSCSSWLSIDKFNYNTNRWDGVSAYCKSCNKIKGYEERLRKTFSSSCAMIK